MTGLVLRNLRYYWRGNLAVLLGVTVGAMVLTGSLFVGDSLRGSLRARAERQANGVTAAWMGSRLIDYRLPKQISPDVVAALVQQATVSSANGTSRVTVYGMNANEYSRLGIEFQFHSSENAVVSKRLAEKLGVKVGDKIQLSQPTFSQVPRASLLGRRDIDELTTKKSLRIIGVLDREPAADFSLTPGTTDPMNLYTTLGAVEPRVVHQPKVNAMFALAGTAKDLNAKLKEKLIPEFWGLNIQSTGLRHYDRVESESLMLSPEIVQAVVRAARTSVNEDESIRPNNGYPVEPTTVYLANWIAADDKHRIPYSIVAAVNADAKPPLGPFLPAGVDSLGDHDIVLTDWSDSPLKDVPVGSPITIIYFKPEVETGAVEASETFKLVGRIPLDGVANDPNLTPPFPGITDKLTIGEWNPPFPFDNKRIKAGDVNERYWEKYKTTPKAYISRAAGERLFASRFGVVTSMRVAIPNGPGLQQLHYRFIRNIQQELPPEKLGIQFEDTRERLAKASVGGTDFGGLFLGFSLFLIVAALVLVGLLVRLAVERRARDIGSLFAIGFSPKRIRRSLLLEGLIVTLLGSLVGLGLGALFARGLIRVLTALWPDPAVAALLQPHMTVTSALIGTVAAILMAMAAIALALRGLVKLPVPMLLRGRTEKVVDDTQRTRRKRLSQVFSVVAIPLAVVILVASVGVSNPDFRAMGFFAGGGLLFAAGIVFVRSYLAKDRTLTAQSSLAALGRRNAGRFLSRSTLTVLLLGAASFLLVSIESFRRRPESDFAAKAGGSGGFNYLASVDIPLFHPIDREPGRGDFLDLYRKETQDRDNAPDAAAALSEIKSLIPLRRRGGDDASCLNLYQAGRPRILGVPQELIDRGGFAFSQTEAATPEEKANPWLLLKPRADGVIPVIGEQNSVMWMLKKAVGDEIDLPDESGAMRKCRIVATLQDSVFQSELLMSDAAFRELYPREEGYSEFLIDSVGDASRVLETGLRSHGMIVTPSRDRVAAYQAVVGTYLTTFQLLGGFGLLLGVLGLAVVVLRGVWDRLGEFALLRAVGYSPRDVRRVVLAENLLLLVLGLGLGLVAALVSVAPHLAAGGQWPWRGVLMLLATAALLGALVIRAATGAALRFPILSALRNE